MSQALERRYVTRPLEVRAEGHSPSKLLVGYAAVFNSLSEDLGGFRERIIPGAFKRSLETNTDIRALVDHETGLMTIGRTSNGTLKLVEDEIGLRVEITPPDTTVGQDIRKLVAGGYVTQMSFGFRFVEGGERVLREGEQIISELLDLDLHEVSVVTFPAYRATAVTTRSVDKLVPPPSPNSTPLLDGLEDRYLKLKALR